MSDATIVVKFGDSVSDGDKFFVVELDDEKNINNDGEVLTQFVPGDNIYFLMHYDKTKLKIVDIKTSDGQVHLFGDTTRENTIEMIFVDEESKHELPHIPNNTPTASWYGNVANINRDERIITVDSWPCIGNISYRYKATSAKLVTPNVDLEAEEIYRIVIAIYTEAA